MGAGWDGVPDFLDVAVRDLNGLNNQGVLSNMQEEEGSILCNGKEHFDQNWMSLYGIDFGIDGDEWLGWSSVDNEAKSLQARQMEKKMFNSDLRACFELKKQGVVE